MGVEPEIGRGEQRDRDDVPKIQIPAVHADEVHLVSAVCNFLRVPAPPDIAPITSCHLVGVDGALDLNAKDLLACVEQEVIPGRAQRLR